MENFSMVNKMKRTILTIVVMLVLSFLYGNPYRNVYWFLTANDLPNPKTIYIDAFTSIYEYHDFCELIKDGCHNFSNELANVFEGITLDGEIVETEEYAKAVIDELEKYATKQRDYENKREFAFTTSILIQIYTRLYAYKLLEDANIMLSIMISSSEIFKK